MKPSGSYGCPWPLHHFCWVPLCHMTTGGSDVVQCLYRKMRAFRKEHAVLRTAVVVLVAASMAASAPQAAEHWLCQSVDGVMAAQDRPCAPSQRTVSAPASAVDRPAPAGATVPVPAAPAMALETAFQPLIALVWKLALAGIALLTIATAGRLLLPARRRRGRAAARSRGGASSQDTQRAASASPDHLAPPSQWNVQVLRALEWKRFEEVCEGFWKAKGYRARSTGPGPDGGVDVVIAEQRAPDRVFAVAQCKAWSKPVGVEPVRALWGARDHFGAQLAIFYSAAGFSPDARAFADGKHLKLVAADELLTQLHTLPPAECAALLRHVTRGDYLTPSCPKCEIKMIRKPGKAGRSDYWLCPDVRSCRTRPVPVRGSA